MTQKYFMKKLLKGIVSLPKVKVKEIQEDITQHFHEGLINGKDETEITKMLGDPEALAKEYTDLYFNQNPYKKRNSFATIGNFIALLLLNLILLPIWIISFTLLFIPIIGICIAFYSTIILIGVSIQLIFPNLLFVTDYLSITFFGSLAIISLGLLIFVIGIRSNKIIIKLFKKYLLWNYKIIKGDNINGKK